MGIKTEIALCDSTVNPLVGCHPRCELGDRCYAANLVKRWAGKPGWPTSFDQPELFTDRLCNATRWPNLTGTNRPTKPWLNGLPRLIFVCDLADPFCESAPAGGLWLLPYIEYMAKAPHIWLILTKRPAGLRKLVCEWGGYNGTQFPANIWGGVSVTSQATAWRMSELLAVPSLAVRFLSCEPLLGPLDLRNICHQTEHDGYDSFGNFWEINCENHCTWRGFEEELIPDPAQSDDDAERNGTRYVCPVCHSDSALVERDEEAPAIDWVIAGGESGPHARPCHPDWIRSLRDQCQAAHVPFFFKQWGEWQPVGQFDSFFQWVARAKVWLAGRTKAACLDMAGLLCRRGEDFERARDEHTFPIAVLDRIGKKAAGRELDGREWNEFPQTEPAL